MDDSQVTAWIAKWQKSGGAVRANYVSFLKELCRVMGVEKPDPMVPEEPENAYIFEKNIDFTNGDGTNSTKRVDPYRRRCFVCETVQQGVEAEDKARPLSTKPSHERTAVERQIAASDRGIDQLVYELYGLTDKEIALVEEATKSHMTSPFEPDEVRT